MLPVDSYLVWEGGLHGDSHGVITGMGEATRSLAIAPNGWLIDCIISSSAMSDVTESFSILWKKE